MNTQIDKSIIQKAKEVLQVEDELSSIELLKFLKDYRKRIHPDKFTEEKAQKDATEKFKQVGCTIEELNTYIENEKLNRGAKELALFEPLYDNVSLEKKLEDALEGIANLEKKVTILSDKNEKLNLEKDEKFDINLKNENIELKKLYKPSKQNIASLGILFLLSAMFAVMTKVEDVSILLKKYSPLPESTLNTIIFSAFIFMLILVIKQYIENKIISQKASDVCSPQFNKNFWDYLNTEKTWEDEEDKDFTEGDVFSFIYGKENIFKKFFASLGFKLFQIETSDRLKNFFINSLLNKQLIDISIAKSLDRTFAIKSGQKKYFYLE